jgi:phosphoglucosamine mutase
MTRYPQVMINVRVKERVDPTRNEKIQAAVRRVEDALDGAGRVVLRASGTEPVIRVMVEGREEPVASQYAHELAEAVRTAV